MIKLNADLYRIVSRFMSKEETRYYLQGVFVEPHAVKGVTMTATDGHRLLCAYDENGVCDQSAIIRLSPDALKACKTKPRENGRLLVVDGLEATVFETALDDAGATVLGDKLAVSAKCFVDGTFPDWRRVLPNPIFGVDAMPGTFQGKYLADFCAAAEDIHALYATAKVSGLRVLSHDPESPALIVFPNYPTAFGVLMPVRATDVRRAPDWLVWPNGKPHVTAEPVREAAE